MKRIQSVSIIIPVYNTSAEIIRRLISSILAQEIKGKVEIVVVYDGNRVQLDEEFEKSIREKCLYKQFYIKHSGVSIARNVGIDASTGDWLLFADADDRFKEDALSAFIEFISSCDADVVLANYEVKLTANQVHGTVVNRVNRYAGISKDDLGGVLAHDAFGVANHVGVVWGAAFRRSFIEANCIRFNSKLAIAEDTEFAVNSYLCSSCVMISNITLYEYIRNTESTVQSFNIEYPRRVKSAVSELANLLSVKEALRTHEGDLSKFAVDQLILLMVHYVFNPRADWSNEQRRKEYSELINDSMFSKAITRVKCSEYNYTRAVCVLLLKLQLFQPLKMICAFRNRQLGK